MEGLLTLTGLTLQLIKRVNDQLTPLIKHLLFLVDVEDQEEESQDDVSCCCIEIDLIFQHQLAHIAE